MQVAQSILRTLSEYGVYLFELICILVMLWGGIRALILLLLSKKSVTLYLSRYMNIALLFKLGAEIIRLAYVQTFTELGIVAGIVGLHAAISFIIQWENRREASPAGKDQEKAAAAAARYLHHGE